MISIIGMSEKIISNITNQIPYNNIPKYNNLEKYNNLCIPENTTIKNPDAKNCRNITWTH